MLMHSGAPICLRDAVLMLYRRPLSGMREYYALCTADEQAADFGTMHR